MHAARQLAWFSTYTTLLNTVQISSRDSTPRRANYVLSQCRVDATLRSYGMRSCGEELGYAGGVEAGLCQAECRSKTCSTGTDDDGIVLVVYDRVFTADMGRGLLRPERLAGDNTLRRPCGREVAGLSAGTELQNVSRARAGYAALQTLVAVARGCCLAINPAQRTAASFLIEAPPPHVTSGCAARQRQTAEGHWKHCSSPSGMRRSA